MLATSALTASASVLAFAASRSSSGSRPFAYSLVQLKRLGARLGERHRGPSNRRPQPHFAHLAAALALDERLRSVSELLSADPFAAEDIAFSIAYVTLSYLSPICSPF
jgi:hypothetical protein